LGIVVDETRDVAYYAELDSEVDGIVAVDLTTGQRTSFSTLSVPLEAQPVDFGTPLGVALDQPNDRLLVADGMRDTIIAVSLSDGTRSAIDESTTNLPLGIPRGIVLYDDRAWVADLYTDSVVSIDLRPGPTSGDREIVTGPDRGAGPRLSRPYNLAVDAVRDRIIVTDADFSLPLAVSLSADRVGDRSLLEANTVVRVGEGPSFTNAAGIARGGSSVYLSDVDFGGILALDLRTGVREVVADLDVVPDAFGFDERGGRFFVYDDANDILLSVSRDDGGAVGISDRNSPTTNRGCSTGPPAISRWSPTGTPCSSSIRFGPRCFGSTSRPEPAPI
ncbi:MAG: hypothetical protein AAGA56_26750, partial [Myxococcota bacterium]